MAEKMLWPDQAPGSDRLGRDHVHLPLWLGISIAIWLGWKSSKCGSKM